MDPRPTPSRRDFLAAGLAAGAVAAGAASPDEPRPTPVKLPPMKAETEQADGPPPTPLPPGQRLGVAVVGLGRLSLEEILPALGRCKYAKLAALVSGDRAKAEAVARQYGVESKHLYDYKSFDNLRDDPAVDIVYVVLPNGLHPEYTARAAAAGKHVLCEKPMANTSRDCEAMIAACKKAGRTLMIAYRCQYEPHNLAAMELARAGDLGPLRHIEAVNGQNMARTPQWRLDKALAGGGSLPDVGIYCLNAARYLTGEEPVEVFGQVSNPENDPRFKEVEDRVAFQLRFPSGVLASCQSSYASHESRRLRGHCEAGWFDLDPAFAYRGLELKVARGKGKAEAIEHRKLPEVDQFAREIDHMAERVMAKETPRTPGEEGMQDLRIIEAIYESAREGRVVKMAALKGNDVTRGPVPSAG